MNQVRRTDPFRLHFLRSPARAPRQVTNYNLYNLWQWTHCGGGGGTCGVAPSVKVKNAAAGLAKAWRRAKESRKARAAGPFNTSSQPSATLPYLTGQVGCICPQNKRGISPSTAMPR